MSKLTQDTLEQWLESRVITTTLERKINNRVDEIINLFFDIFNIKKSAKWIWHYPIDEDGGAIFGSIKSEWLNQDKVLFIEYTQWPHQENFYHETVDYSWRFPGEFLTMTDEEITKHIKTELELIELEKNKENCKAKEEKDKTENIAAKALQKLTKAEKIALGLSK